jgi:eukaryotic-like serine/threonine-protein kinase
MTSESMTSPDREGSTFSSGTGPAASAPDGARPVPGVIGDWQVEAHLGSGRWSEVYLARGMLDGTPRRLALKVVYPGEPPETGEAVVREAHALSTFRHPHLMRSYAAWQIPPGSELAGAVVFLLPPAELSLADHLQARSAATGGEPADVPAICAAVAGIADALAYLHGSRKPDGSGPVIHNDVKPGNILQVSGQWLLSDLGIASPPGEDRLSAHAGSLSYMAPEYLTDPPAGKHPAGDVWALGVVLHRWLTGRFPFPGDTPPQRAQAVQGGAEPLVDVTDPALRALAAAMIARRPQDRPSAAEVARRLRAAAGLPRRRLPARAGIAAAAAVLIAVGWAGGAFLFPGSPGQPARTALRFASYGTAFSRHPSQPVLVMAQPRLDARVVGRLANGAPAGILCTAHGDMVAGNWGRTTLWDRISFGRSAGWVSDGLFYTGTNNAVAPACKSA